METEMNNKILIMTYGRFSIPHLGHIYLIDQMLDALSENPDADIKIFLTDSSNTRPDENPLSFEDKRYFLIKSIGEEFESIIDDEPHNNFVELISEIADMGYTDLILFVGEDRVSDFENILVNYGDFESFQVMNAGERNPESDDIDGISGTKIREFILNNDYKSYEESISSNLTDDEKTEMFNLIRENLMFERE